MTDEEDHDDGEQNGCHPDVLLGESLLGPALVHDGGLVVVKLLLVVLVVLGRTRVGVHLHVCKVHEGMVQTLRGDVGCR